MGSGWTQAAVAQAKGLELPTWQLSVAFKAGKLTEKF